MHTRWLTGLLTAALAAVMMGLAGAAAAESASCEPGKLAEKYPGLADKKIRIGADPQTKPYVYRNPDNFEEVIGFDADLARAVFDCVGADHEFFLGGWSGLLPAVMAGQIDVMWDALYYLPERAKKVDFIVYMQAGTGALAQEGNPKNIKGMGDLCGLNVSTLLGTVEEAALRDQDKKCQEAKKKSIDIKVGPDNAAAMRLLLNKRVDLFLIDLGLAGGLAQEKPNEVDFVFKLLTGYTQAAAVPNGNDDLARAIYDGLRIAQANGTQRKLYEKYAMDPELQLPAKILRE